jgi:hypothetical protein
MRTSSAHAQCNHFPSEGDQRRALLARTPKGTNQSGKERDLSGWHLRQIGAPDRLRAGTTRQPKQDQNKKHDHSSTSGTLHTAPAVAADAAARAAGRAAASVRAAT